MARKTSSRDFLDGIGKLAEEFRRQIEAEVDGFDPDPAARLARRDICGQKTRAGFEAFARGYFPHYIKLENSRLHDFLYERLPAMLASLKSEADAIAAPRGEAKSTICSQIFVIWCIAALLMPPSRRSWIGLEYHEPANTPTRPLGGSARQ